MAKDRPLTDAESRRIDELLGQWLERSRVALSAYNDATTRTVANERRLGIPTVVLTSVVATGLFATLNKDPAIGWRIATGVIAVVAAVLSALQTFLRQAERAEHYREAARSYGRIRRQVERARLFPPGTRVEADRLLKLIGEELAEAARGKANVPQKIWDRAEFKIKRTSDARGLRALHLQVRERLDFGVSQHARLDEDHQRYFDGLDRARIVPVSQVRPARKEGPRRQSVETARRRMREAAAGARDRRAPLEVRQAADGVFEIIDGNATFAVATQDGWETVPVQLADAGTEPVAS